MIQVNKTHNNIYKDLVDEWKSVCRSFDNKDNVVIDVNDIVDSEKDSNKTITNSSSNAQNLIKLKRKDTIIQSKTISKKNLIDNLRKNSMEKHKPITIFEDQLQEKEMELLRSIEGNKKIKFSKEMVVEFE